MPPHEPSSARLIRAARQRDTSGSNSQTTYCGHVYEMYDMYLHTYTHGWFVTVRTAVGSWDRASPPGWYPDQSCQAQPARIQTHPLTAVLPLSYFLLVLYLYAHLYDRTARFQHASVCIYPLPTKAFL